MPRLFAFQRRYLLAALALPAVMGGVAFVLLRGTPSSSLTVEVAIAPELAATLGGEQALHQRIDDTLTSALGGRVAVEVRAAPPFSARLGEAMQSSSALVGYGAARQSLDRLRTTAPQTEAELDRYADDVARALEGLKESEAALDRERSAGAIVSTSPGTVGIEITGARQYAPECTPGERWAIVRTGVARELYGGKPDLLLQSVANQVARAVGLLAGVQLRAGEPADAMVDLVDFGRGDPATRDAKAVKFSKQEQAAVSKALAVAAGGDGARP